MWMRCIWVSAQNWIKNSMQSSPPSNLTLQLQQIFGFLVTRVKGNRQGNQTSRTDYCDYFFWQKSKKFPVSHTSKLKRTFWNVKHFKQGNHGWLCPAFEWQVLVFTGKCHKIMVYQTFFQLALLVINYDSLLWINLPQTLKNQMFLRFWCIEKFLLFPRLVDQIIFLLLNILFNFPNKRVKRVL